MPAAPPVIHVSPSAGAPPSAPGAIYEKAPDGKAVLAISGVATSGINGSVIYAGLIAGKPAWSTDGTQTAGAANTIVEYISGTSWKVSRGSSYSATKVSAAAAPDGLTTWTVGTGTGSPVIAAAAAPVAGAVHVMPTAAPGAVGAVHLAPTAAPGAVGAVHASPGIPAPSAPPAIYTP